MRTRVKIIFGLYDTTAKADSSMETNFKQSWVDLNELQKEDENTPAAYCTLEHNNWVLDGKQQPLPDNPHDLDLGLWSNVQSGADGVFTVAPVLTVMFNTSVHSSIGLSFRFYEPTNDYCSLVHIAWYDESEALIIEGDYTINNWSGLVAEKVLNYKKIVITFKKTSLPYRFLKLTGLDFGEKITWTDRQLTEGHMREQIDMTASSISINTLNLTACSDDERFDIYNPQGVYEVLQERQALDVQRYADGVQLDSSTYYLNSWEEANENPASLEAYDLIGVLDTVDYKGDLCRDALASTLIADIMNTANVQYSLDSTLSNEVVTGWLQNGTCREALTNVLFAIGAVADCSRGDVIKIYPVSLDDTAAGEMPMSRQAMEQETKQNKAVTGVELTAHSYKIKSGSTVSDIYEEDLEVGITDVVFSEPHDVYKVTSGNATIVEKSANGMTLNVTTAGTVIVNGWKYDDNTVTIGYYESLLSGQKANVVTAELDCTLINKNNAQVVAERLYNYYLNRYSLDLDILQQQELVGKYLKFENQRAKQFVGFAEELDIDLCGGFITAGNFVGKLKAGDTA